MFIILIFPPYFDIEEIEKYSYYISKYVNDDVIENMRELYKYDKNSLNQFRKELYIRGIGFKKYLQNNFLKGIDYNLYPYIKVSDEKHRYKTFPFDLFGLTQIVSELKISSDKFFNYIPINGFGKYIPYKRKELFISKLQEYGFELIYEHDEASKEKIDSEDNISNFIPEKLFPHFINYVNDAGYNINEIEEALNNYKNAKSTRLKTYDKVYQYCVERKIITPNETIKYNLYNRELKELLSRYGYRYGEFMDKYFSIENILSDRPYVYGQGIVQDIYENYDVKIEQVELNLNYKLTKLTNHVNYILIKDILISEIINFYGLSNVFLKETRLVKELGKEFYDKSIIEILLRFLENLPDLSTTKNEISSVLTEKEYKILRNRNEGKTLEEIAKNLNITRERVRQIEAKAKRNLKDSTKLTEIINFILFKFRNKSIIQLSHVVKFLNLEFEYHFIIAILLEDNPKYFIYTEHMLIITRSTYKNMRNEIEWYISNDYKVIPLNELEYIHEENMEFAINLLSEFNYKLVNHNFVQSKITIVAAIEYIMWLHKDKIFVNNNEGYEILKNKVETMFNKTIESNPRALFSRVADASNVILIDKSSFKYEDFEDIDGNFLVKLKQLVSNELTQGPYADPRSIYKNHPKLMEENKIYSYSHLYSLTKNFYAEDFNVGHQNTLYIYQKESKQLTAEDILTSYLKEHSPVGNDVILKDLKWKRIKLEQMIPRLSNVILNSNQEAILIEGMEAEENYNKLYSLINSEVEKGYLVTADIYIKVAFDTELWPLLNKYYIKDLHSFSQFVKSKFMHMLGFSQFLYSKHSEYKSIEDIMPFELPKIITTKELQNFIIDKGYSGQRYYKSKDILVEKNKIIPYDNNIFLNLEKFDFSSSVEKEIMEKLNFESKENLFVTRLQLQKINVELDDTLMVTPEIIAHVAKLNGYHLYEAYYGSTYELPIITRKKLNSYAELIYTIIKKEFKMIYNEENLLSFLKKYGLVNEGADQIYSTIKESEYFTFDSLGFFQLDEGGVSNV